MNIVDYVIDFDDSDGSANDAIEQCLKDFDKVIFVMEEIEGRIIYQSMKSTRIRE